MSSPPQAWSESTSCEAPTTAAPTCRYAGRRRRGADRRHQVAHEALMMRAAMSWRDGHPPALSDIRAQQPRIVAARVGRRTSTEHERR